jgi:hypothetical protein
VPDWLRDVALPTAPAAAPKEDLPSWLQDAGVSTIEPSGQHPPAAPVDAVPTWMQDPAPASADAAIFEDLPSTITPFEPVGDDIPNWLQEMQPPPAAPPAQSDMSRSPGQRRHTTGDLPNWLRDFDSEPPIVDMSQEDLDYINTPASDVPNWLQESLSDVPNLKTPAPAAPADDIPEWLRIADESAPVVAPAQAAAPVSDIPAWLQQPTSAMPPAISLDDVALESTTSGEGGVPDWLRDIDEEAQATIQSNTGITPSIPAPESAPATASPDLPAWLQAEDAALAQPIADSPAAPAATPSDIPPWLQESPAPASSPSQSDIPPWLMESASASNEQGGGAATVDLDNEPITRSSSMPDWLREDLPSAPVPTTRFEPTPTTRLNDDDVAATNPLDIPDWLREDLPSAPVPTTRFEPSVTVRLDEPAIPPAAKVAPSWLLDDEPTAPGADIDDTLLGNVDLPAWLRQSVTPDEPPPEPEPEPNASSGSADWLRAFGMPEVAAPTAEPAQSAGRSDIAMPPAIERTPERIAAVALLHELVMQPLPAPLPTPLAAPARWWHKIGSERIIALLLLSAILASLFIPSLNLGGDNNRLGGKTADLYNYIETLNPDSRVLIAYEANLRRSAEIADLEKVVVDHIVGKGIPIVTFSTDIEGALAAAKRETFLASQPDYALGRQYLNLGYVSGGDTALQRLARNARQMISEELIRQNPANNVDTLGVMSKLNSNLQFDSAIINDIRDFDLVVVIADEPGDVESWVEQVWPTYKELPIAFLTTNETAPLIQPAIQIKADFYPLVGLAGAQNYAALRGIQPLDRAPLNAISLSSMMVVGVIFGGGILGIRRRMRQKGNG